MIRKARLQVLRAGYFIIIYNSPALSVCKEFKPSVLQATPLPETIIQSFSRLL